MVENLYHLHCSDRVYNFFHTKAFRAIALDNVRPYVNGLARSRGTQQDYTTEISRYNVENLCYIGADSIWEVKIQESRHGRISFSILQQPKSIFMFVDIL